MNPALPLVELTLADIKAMIPESLVRQLRTIWCAGTYGDAIVANDTLQIIEYFLHANSHICLGIHTNGSARPASWWAALGRLIPHGKGYVRFGIDGLEDTNNLYRRHTSWNTVMRNVTAFIGAGGNAEWDYLVFRHNEHQVEEARALAKKLGFTRFYVKATSRFFDFSTLAQLERTPVKDREGNIEYYLERTHRPEWRSEAMTNAKAVFDQYGGLSHYVQKVEISCKAAAEQSISLTADGLVLPCCWLGSEVHKRNPRAHDPFMKLIEAAGGIEMLSARKQSIKAIVEGRFFQEILPQSWLETQCSGNRIPTCALVCGKALDLRADQWKTTDTLS